MSKKKKSQKKKKKTQEKEMKEESQNKGIVYYIKAVFGTVTKSIFDLGLIVILALFVIFLYVYYTTVSPAALLHRSIVETSTIYDKTGEHELYKIHGEENRKVIGHDEIPDTLRWATIAAEDDNFYNHKGIDPFGIVRAAQKNFVAGGAAQGGSTITQQLVRNTFLSREKTIKRKFTEMVLAIKMERHYTKDEILDFYLNEVPYGYGAYGVDAAAEVYFEKEAKDLTIDEAAMLASLPKATTYYSPYGNNVEELKARQQSIIERLGELGLYDAQEIQDALATDTLAKLVEFREEIDAPHFVFYVREQLEQMYGEDVLRRGGLKIYTTLDYEMQKRAEEDVSAYAKKLPSFGASNAALVAVQPKTGDVLAMVGSIDYFDKENDGEVNVALRLRQPGSSFKPIVYAAGFDKGYQPETLLYDVPTSFGKSGSGKEYRPQNFDGKHNGLVSVRKAIQGSLNVPAVKMLYLTGIDNAIDFAETLGFTTLTDRQRFGLSLVLGGGEVKMLEHVGAFAVFANDGVRAPVHGINKVIDATGKEIGGPPEPERAISEQVARKMNDILSDNKARAYVFGSNAPVYVPGKNVAAKTGTTQDYRDALTLGYTPELAVGVWVGNNDSTLMRAGSIGSKVAAPLWNTFISRELESLPDTQFEPYQKVSSSNFMVTGKRPDGVSDGGGETQYYNKNSGKKISAEKARKMDPKKLEKKYRSSFGGHSILHYVNKNMPLDEGAKPNFADSMLKLWDEGISGGYENKEEK
ncbi:MAG: transglycosylase domain-containing protein [Patescibacteria group bacterium]|nr:transglycosylase domain-containing protein [Patescibacteria group bacterium]